jgi:DNA/RNA-binding domain of Phe-tRNA-synthetase-like protein
MEDNALANLEIAISDEVLKSYPDVTISGLAVKGIDTKTDKSEELERYMNHAVYQHEDTDDSLAKSEIQNWRSVYSDMGVKPSKVLCSFESLYKRVSKGKKVFGINKLVDAYNAVSLKHCLCMGGYDLDQITGSISLRYGRKGEEMLPIGGDKPIRIDEKVVAYSDAGSILCVYWNHRDADHTQITDKTKNVIFFVDQIQGGDNRAKLALTDLSKLISDFSNNDVTIDFFSLDKQKPVYQL